MINWKAVGCVLLVFLGIGLLVFIGVLFPAVVVTTLMIISVGLIMVGLYLVFDEVLS